MRNLYILLKNNIITTLGINKILKGKKSMLIVSIVFILYIIFSLLLTSGSYAYVIANALEKYNLITFMITIFFFIASFTTFTFTIYSSKSGLFNSNDNDLLLSLPIKSSTVLASRLIMIMLWNLITAAFVILPAFVVYAMKVDVPVQYYFFVSVIFILLPVIPTVLASLIGYAIAYLTSKSNSKNWFEILISFMFFFAIFYLTSNGDKVLKYMVNDMTQLENFIKWAFHPVYLVNSALSEYNYISLLFYTLINIGALVIFVAVLSKSFKAILSKLKENKTKKNYVVKTLKTGSINKALFIKEVKRYFSSPVYVLNTSFGVIMILFLAVGSIFYDKEVLLTMLGFTETVATPFQMLLLVIAFVTFISNTASASVSLEGSNFWIVKSLPISEKKILNVKILLNLVIVLPITYISIIILRFTFGLSTLEMLTLLLLSTIFSVFTSYFGLLTNLKFPKLDATSDIVIAKRSLSVMISTLVPMVLIFSIVGLYSEISKNINFNLFIFIITLAIILLIVLERILLNSWGVKRIKEIN